MSVKQNDTPDLSDDALTFQVTELKELISHVAHEINNPLTVLLTRSQMLKQSLENQKPVTNEMLTQYVNKTHQQSEKIKKIITGMRTLIATPNKTEYVDYDVHMLINEAHALVATILKENKIDFVLNSIQKEKLIKCNPAELVQLFVNLFDNSIQALSETSSPKIEIAFTEDNTYLHFYFIDNGPGIKQEIDGKIFTPFFTTKSASAALGLGLTLSRKIAKSYGGDVVLDASRGRSCFHISLSKQFG